MDFKFAFSLEVLNHLGRGLYRSFATVVAEAISNAWDAGATKVEITLDPKNDILIIEDNGVGMDDDDFQNKFLKVGYSRRRDAGNQSSRTVMGRKGIGKLAMLSISESVEILSLKKGSQITGGVVHNKDLDQRIESDGNYTLGEISDGTLKFNSGTKIIFSGLKEKMNKEGTLIKYIAAQFNFLFSDDSEETFDILVNEKKVGADDLKEINERTQFVWSLGDGLHEGMKNRFGNLKRVSVIKDTVFQFEGRAVEIRGFIASVELPSNLTVRGTDFKVGVSLFSNGRLRQENAFQEITSRRVVESYLYGEIHVNDLDGGDDVDRFTSSREGIIKDDALYQAFLEKLREIQSRILDEWDEWRVEIRADGDPDNKKRMPLYKRRLMESKNERGKSFEKRIERLPLHTETKKRLKDVLRDLSEGNTQVYQDLFILENLYRAYIKNQYPDLCALEKGFKGDDDVRDFVKRQKTVKSDRKEDEERHALKDIITKDDNYLNYADLVYLGILVDKLRPSKEKKRYRPQTDEAVVKDIVPVRNAVMHTNEITEEVTKWDKIKNVIEYMDKMVECDEE